jgi:hypothetical protein
VNCPLCEAPVAADAARCADCGMDLELAPGRPDPFSLRVVLLWAAGLLLVFAVALVIVALVPA